METLFNIALVALGFYVFLIVALLIGLKITTTRKGGY